MRQVFLLLVLANVGLVAWWYYGPDVVEEAPSLSPQSAMPYLTLVGEAAAEPAVVAEQEVRLAAAPAPADTPSLQVAAGCYAKEVTEAQGKALAAQLRALGAPARLQDERIERQGYRVYLPAFPNRAAAQEVVRSLEARRVQDYHVVLVGDRRNEISLGVFSTPAAAERRSAELKALGFQPRQEEIGLPSRRWMLHTEAPASGAASLRELLRDEEFEGPNECAPRAPA